MLGKTKSSSSRPYGQCDNSPVLFQLPQPLHFAGKRIKRPPLTKKSQPLPWDFEKGRTDGHENANFPICPSPFCAFVLSLRRILHFPIFDTTRRGVVGFLALPSTTTRLAAGPLRIGPPCAISLRVRARPSFPHFLQENCFRRPPRPPRFLLPNSIFRPSLLPPRAPLEAGSANEYISVFEMKPAYMPSFFSSFYLGNREKKGAPVPTYYPDVFN